MLVSETFRYRFDFPLDAAYSAQRTVSNLIPSVKQGSLGSVCTGEQYPWLANPVSAARPPFGTAASFIGLLRSLARDRRTLANYRSWDMAAIRSLEVGPHCRLLVDGLGEVLSLILLASPAPVGICLFRQRDPIDRKFDSLASALSCSRGLLYRGR